MNKNVISSDDAASLLSKLLSERVPVHALLIFPSGTRVVFSGFVDSVTPQTGIVLSVARPPSDGPATISVPIFDRECEFGYADARELPEKGREELVQRYGDAVLSFRFIDGDFLGITFTP